MTIQVWCFKLALCFASEPLLLKTHGHHHLEMRSIESQRRLFNVREVSLKIWLSQGSAGSIPVLGTEIADHWSAIFLVYLSFLSLEFSIIDTTFPGIF